jgi:hypothetical protein
LVGGAIGLAAVAQKLPGGFDEVLDATERRARWGGDVFKEDEAAGGAEDAENFT